MVAPTDNLTDFLVPQGTRDPSALEVVNLGKQLNELLRYETLVNKNLEVFVEYVLGYKPLPFHREYMRWQQSCSEGLLLAWRGSAKSTYCTIGRVLFEIVQNPNVRILIAAASSAQAENIIRGIKAHLESNSRFREIFGDLAKNAPLWTTTEFTVNRKTSYAPEPTVMAVGAGTALPSRHYDVIICDDLVISDNAATEGQRKKIRDYYYSTLLPTLDPKHGKLWVIGTRWHEQDLYDWLQKEDMKDSTFVLGVLDEDDKSRWEEQFSTEKMLRLRKANLNSFMMQYQCVGGMGSAGVFSEFMFEFVETLPPNLILWQGVDFAVGQKEHNDFFAHCTVGVDRLTKHVYLINAFKRKTPFPNQVTIIRDQYTQHSDVMRVVAEANGQQLGLLQQIQKDIPDLPLLPRYNQTDKFTKAQKVAFQLANNPLKVLRSQGDFVTLLLSFPNLHGSKDVFDAFELAYSQSQRGARKVREESESAFDGLI